MDLIRMDLKGVRDAARTEDQRAGCAADGLIADPRGDLAFKGKHYVSLAMFITSYNGSKGTVVGKFARIVPIPANAACQ